MIEFNKCLKYLKNNKILLNNNIINEYKNYDYKCIENNLIKIGNDMLNRDSKYIRSIFAYKFGELLGISNKLYIKNIQRTIEILHSGTLIIDDIQDQSLKRRGDTAVHIKYGTDIAINTGIYMLFNEVYNIVNDNYNESNNYLSDIDKFKIYNTYNKSLTNLLIGLNWDIGWNKINDYNLLPNKHDYLKMVEYKTSELFKLIINLLYVKKENNNIDEYELINIAKNFGILFQINDDFINLKSDNYSDTKGQFCEDLTEGKITLIIIHAISNLNNIDKKRLFDILLLKTNDIILKQEALNLINKSKSLEYTEELILKISKELIDDIKNKLPEDISNFLNDIICYFINKYKK